MPLDSGLDSIRPQTGDRHEFRFVANLRPLVQGAIGGNVVLAGLVGWAWWTGRMVNFDTTSTAVFLGSALLALPTVVVGQWSSARKAASSLGHLELDDHGARWRRPNGSLGFDASWNDVERATVDARNATILLLRKEAGPILLGVVSQQGVPSGLVVPERFGEIVDLVGRRVSTSPHEGTTDAGSGRRSLLLGIGACVAALALYAVNVQVGAVLHWERWLLPIPVTVGVVGALVALAGARMRAGAGPLVSPLYGLAFRSTILRFLVVATVANFVLLAVSNTLGR